MASTIQERCFSLTLSGWKRVTVERIVWPKRSCLNLLVLATSKWPHVRSYQVGASLLLLVHNQIVLLDDSYEAVRSVPINRNCIIISNSRDPGPDLCFVINDQIALLTTPSLEQRTLKPFPDTAIYKVYNNGRIAYRTRNTLGLYTIVRHNDYRKIWTRSCDDSTTTNLRLVADHILELTAVSLDLYDAKTGVLLWKYQMPDADPASLLLACLSSNGKVVTYHGWHSLSCYDPETGRCIQNQYRTFSELKQGRSYGWVAPPSVLATNLILAPYCQFQPDSSFQFILVDILLGEQIVFSMDANDSPGLFVVYRKGPLLPIRIGYISTAAALLEVESDYVSKLS